MNVRELDVDLMRLFRRGDFDGRDLITSIGTRLQRRRTVLQLLFVHFHYCVGSVCLSLMYMRPGSTEKLNDGACKIEESLYTDENCHACD